LSVRRASTFVSMIAALAAVFSARAAAQVPGEVQGRVADVRTHHPIPSARIEILGRSETATTDLDGSFVLRGLEPRIYTLRVRAIGYAARESDVEVVNTQTIAIEVNLEPVSQQLRSVVVVGGRDTSALTAVTFDRQAIEASGRRDLGELLQSTPGVVVTQAGGAGSETHISIQGSSANEVLVLLDGVPVNSVITGTADLSRITLETVEHVTVLPGAQSARYGGRALGGVIEIQTRHPDQEASLLLRSGAWGERDAAFTVGDGRMMGAWRAGASLTADYRTVTGDFPYTVPAVRGGGTATRLNSDFTSRQVMGALSLANDSTDIRLHGEWEGMDRGLAGSIVQQSLTGRENNWRATGGVDGHWHSGLLSGSASTSFTSEHAVFVDTAPPFGGTYDDVVNATTLGASTDATAALGVASVSVGGETRMLNVESSELEPGAPHSQHFVGVWSNVRTRHLSLPADIDFVAEASAREDWDSLLPGSSFSPRVSVTFSRGPLAMTTSAGSAYSPPSLADEFFQEGVLVRPNPNLQPERVHADLSTRLVVRDVVAGPFRLGASAAAYRADIDGMILWTPDYRFVWSPSNFDVHRSGWDLGAQAALPRAGVDAQATLSQTNVLYTGPILSGQVVYRPRTTASINAGITRSRVRFDLTNRYVGERRTVAGSSLNLLDPYWLTDAKVTVPFTSGMWSFDTILGLENAFNRNAAMLVDYPFPARTWTITFRMKRTGPWSAR
jgi:outer membrane cobalamin receptor